MKKGGEVHLNTLNHCIGQGSSKTQMEHINWVSQDKFNKGFIRKGLGKHHRIPQEGISQVILTLTPFSSYLLLVLPTGWTQQEAREQGGLWINSHRLASWVVGWRTLEEVASEL